MTPARGSRSPVVRQAVLVAVAGYAVVGLFGAAYAVITALWPHLTRSTTTVIAVLAAAPAALALIWPHLATIKAFGIEVSLTHADTNPIPPEIIDTFMIDLAFAAAETELEEPIQPETTIDVAAEPPLLPRLDELRTITTARVLTVDLGAGHQWLSTRLYLLAAIADDFLRVPRFVFTARLPQDGFIGMTRPAAVKTALGLALPPEVDATYSRARRDAAALPPGDRLRHVITQSFGVVASIERPGGPASEVSVPWVTSELLDDWMTAAGKVLDTRAIMTTGLSDQQLVLAVALDTGDRYIALVAATRRLQRVVDRLDVLGQVAATPGLSAALRQ